MRLIDFRLLIHFNCGSDMRNSYIKLGFILSDCHINIYIVLKVLNNVHQLDQKMYRKSLCKFHQYEESFVPEIYIEFDVISSLHSSMA